MTCDWVMLLIGRAARKICFTTPDVTSLGTASYPTACSRYPSDQRRLGTEHDSARRPRPIFPTSFTGDVTSEIAEDDWERGCVGKLNQWWCREMSAVFSDYI